MLFPGPPGEEAEQEVKPRLPDLALLFSSMSSSLSSPISLGFWSVGVIEKRHRQAGWSLPQPAFHPGRSFLGALLCSR